MPWTLSDSWQRRRVHSIGNAAVGGRWPDGTESLERRSVPLDSEAPGVGLGDADST